jgi:hypothetical protein
MKYSLHLVSSTGLIVKIISVRRTAFFRTIGLVNLFVNGCPTGVPWLTGTDYREQFFLRHSGMDYPKTLECQQSPLPVFAR